MNKIKQCGLVFLLCIYSVLGWSNEVASSDPTLPLSFVKIAEMQEKYVANTQNVLNFTIRNNVSTTALPITPHIIGDVRYRNAYKRVKGKYDCGPDGTKLAPLTECTISYLLNAPQPPQAQPQPASADEAVGRHVHNILSIDYDSQLGPLQTELNFQIGKPKAAYVANAQPFSSTPTYRVTHCNIDEELGEFSSCGNITDPALYRPQDVSFLTVDGQKFAYVAQVYNSGDTTSPVLRCPVTAAKNGQETWGACAPVAGAPKGIYAIAFHALKELDVLYAFFSQLSSKKVLQCEMHLDGTVGLCEDSKAGPLGFPGFVTFSSHAGKSYAYVADGDVNTGKVLKCPVAEEGMAALEGCENAWGDNNVLSNHLPGAIEVVINSNQGQNYAFVSRYDAVVGLSKCLLDHKGSFTHCYALDNGVTYAGGLAFNPKTFGAHSFVTGYNAKDVFQCPQGGFSDCSNPWSGTFSGPNGITLQ